MIIRDITKYIEEIAPLNYAEDFDNVGLLVGNYTTEVFGVLVPMAQLSNATNCLVRAQGVTNELSFDGIEKLIGRSAKRKV